MGGQKIKYSGAGALAVVILGAMAGQGWGKKQFARPSPSAYDPLILFCSKIKLSLSAFVARLVRERKLTLRIIARTRRTIR